METDAPGAVGFPPARLAVARILNPRTVAVIGASDDLRKFGARVFNNACRGGYESALIPVNPRRDEVLGVKAYARIGDVA